VVRRRPHCGVLELGNGCLVAIAVPLIPVVRRSGGVVDGIIHGFLDGLTSSGSRPCAESRHTIRRLYAKTAKSPSPAPDTFAIRLSAQFKKGSRSSKGTYVWRQRRPPVGVPKPAPKTGSRFPASRDFRDLSQLPDTKERLNPKEEDDPCR
jgi:hypothetical protein